MASEQDFLNYLNRANPYAPPTPLYGSPSGPVAKSYSDLLAAQQWVQQQQAQRAGQQNAVQAMANTIYAPSVGAAWNPATGKPPPSPWAAPPSQQTVTSIVGGGAAAAAAANPFSVLTNKKSPAIQSLLDKVLSQASVGSGGDGNPYSLYSNTKDAGQGADIAGARNRFNSATANTQQQLADFTANYLSGNAPSKQYAQQEIGAIGNLYDAGAGGMQGQLDQFAREDQLAKQRLVDRQLGLLGGSLKSQRFLGGDSSRMQSQALNTGAQLLAQEADRQAQLRRSNYLTTTDYQLANADRRRQIQDAQMMRGLIPLQASYGQSAAELGQLGQLGNLTGQNTLYNVDTPESRKMRELGVLGLAGDVDQRNNFYTLQRKYEEDLNGLNYRTPRGPQGNYPVQPGQADPYYGDQFQYEPSLQSQIAPPRPRATLPPDMLALTNNAAYARQPDNSYDTYGNYPYASQYLNNPNGGLYSNPLYYPGFDQAKYDRDQQLYL